MPDSSLFVKGDDLSDNSSKKKKEDLNISSNLRFHNNEKHTADSLYIKPSHTDTGKEKKPTENIKFKSKDIVSKKPVEEPRFTENIHYKRHVSKAMEKERPAVVTARNIKIHGKGRAPAKRKTSGKKVVAVNANIISKTVNHGKKQLLKDISIQIREGTLVALLGTAGAGKSTLMDCLNGMNRQGVKGTVQFYGRDLYRHFRSLQMLIGSVPQNKTFHDVLTPEEEFREAAKLRLPAGTTKEEIEQHVERTIQMLNLQNVRKNKNARLSGGEQSRVNVGMELVADRKFLCLDEPDAGLSPNLKHELFEILSNLAHKNKTTILAIIHDVSEIDFFDQVVILVKADNVGRLAFSGTPDEARKKFGVQVNEIYGLLEKNPYKYV